MLFVVKTNMNNGFDDIIFQKKNKAYGAYFLRRRYSKSLTYSLFISLFVFFLISFIALIKSPNVYDFADNELKQNIIYYEQYNMLKNIDTLIVNTHPPKKILAKPKDISYIVKDSIKPEIDTLKIVKLPDKEIDNIENDSLALSDSSRIGSANGIEDGVIFTKVDFLPEFPGGFSALYSYLKNQIKYPEEAKKSKIKGIVKVEFVVNKYGETEKVRIKQGVNILLDNEALRVVKSFPKWKPAIRNGKAVNFLLVAPINFQL